MCCPGPSLKTSAGLQKVHTLTMCRYQNPGMPSVIRAGKTVILYWGSILFSICLVSSMPPSLIPSFFLSVCYGIQVCFLSHAFPPSIACFSSPLINILHYINLSACTKFNWKWAGCPAIEIPTFFYCFFWGYQIMDLSVNLRVNPFWLGFLILVGGNQETSSFSTELSLSSRRVRGEPS